MSNGGDATLWVIDTAKLAVIVATIPVGQRPSTETLTPDGPKLYVVCGRSGSVAVIDTECAGKVTDVAVASCRGASWSLTVRANPRGQGKTPPKGRLASAPKPPRLLARQA